MKLKHSLRSFYSGFSILLYLYTLLTRFCPAKGGGKISLERVIPVTIPIVKGITWFFTDYRTKKEKIRHHLNPVKIVSEGVVILLVIIGGIISPLPKNRLTDLFLPIGVSIFVIGEIIAIRAKIKMGRYWGLPGQDVPWFFSCHENLFDPITHRTGHQD